MGVLLIIIGVIVAIGGIAMRTSAEANLTDWDYLWDNYGNSEYESMQNMYEAGPWVIGIGIGIAVIGIVIVICKAIKERPMPEINYVNNQLTTMINCQACGSLVPAHEKFCNQCGVELVKKAIITNCKTIVCKKCGSVIDDNSKFCNECGEPIKKDIVCPNCSAEITPTSKFCKHCGTKISE